MGGRQEFMCECRWVSRERERENSDELRDIVI
uniref:Uncharacterized protein n=1 Tax=Anguilla anguilla TaxID=7936 RepID=A0A0E9UM11_ANGAN